MRKKLFIAALLILSWSVYNYTQVTDIPVAESDIQWKRFDFFSNSGGLNDAFSPVAIADNEAADLQNVLFTTSGNWKTRDGYDRLATSSLGASVSAVGLTYFKPTSGSKFVVGVFTDDKIRKMDYDTDSPDGTWDDITGSLSFAIGTDNLCGFSVGQDTLIIEDGLNTTAPYKWTGSGNAAALGGSPPNATMVAYHKRMAFAAGNNSNPSTLYYSDVGDIENWTGGLSGNFNVETNDGSVIRAIVPGFDALYIWKDRSIWRLTGDDEDTFVLQRMVSDIGTTSARSVGKVGNEFIFTSDQGGVYIYDGSIGVRLISAKIDGTLDNSNFNRFQYVNSTIFNDDYLVAIASASSTDNDVVMWYDTYNQAWSKMSGINANSMAVVDNGLGEDALVFSDYNGLVYLYPSGTDDDGRAITAFYVTKQYRFPEESLLKDWKLLKVFANQKGNYNLTVETRKDFESSGTTENINLAGSTSTYGSATWGTDRYGGQNLITGRIEVNKDDATFFQIRYSNTNVGQPVEVKGWQIFTAPSDRI